MAQAARKRTSNSAIQSRSKRSRHQDAEAEDGHGHGSMAHKTQRHAVVHGEESEDNQEDDGENLSTQSITELETDITTFIRNTGKNDAWPTSFKNHVRDRESGLLERLGTGSAEIDRSESSFLKSITPFLSGTLAKVGVGVPRRPPLANNNNNNNNNNKPHSPQPLLILDPRPDDQPLFRKTTALIQGSRDLLSGYAELAALRVDTSSRDRLLVTLERERQAIARAIRGGRTVAQADVHALLGFSDEPCGEVEGARQGVNVLRAGAAEAEAKAKARARARATRAEELGESRKRESWGVVAGEVVRVFGKISKVAGEME